MSKKTNQEEKRRPGRPAGCRYPSRTVRVPEPLLPIIEMMIKQHREGLKKQETGQRK